MIRKTTAFFGYLRYDPALLSFGFFVYMGSAFGQTFFIGLFSKELQESFALTHGGFGLIYSIATLLSALVILWSAQFIDKLRLHIWCMLVIAILASGCVLLAMAPNLWWLFVAIFLLRQGGQGLMSDMSFVTVSRYFTAARARAVSTISFGMPSAESLFPIITVIMLAAWGLRTSWLIFAACLLLLWLPVCLLLLRKHHIRHATYMQQIEEDTAIETSDKRIHYRRRDILRDYRFYLLLPAITVPSVAITGVFFHQVYITENHGWTMLEWASLYPLYALFSVSFALISGAIIDRKGVIFYLPSIPLMMGSACFLLIFYGNPLLAALIFALIGMGAGSASTVHGVLWAELYGTKYLGSIRSLALFVMVLASASSPILFGFLFDHGLSVSTVMLFMACYSFAAVLLTLYCRRLFH